MTASPDYATMLRLMVYLIAEVQARTGYWAVPREVGKLARQREPALMRGISEREATGLAYVAQCGHDIGTGLVAEALVAWYGAGYAAGWCGSIDKSHLDDARRRHPEMSSDDWEDVIELAAEHQERRAR